jgi:hypothetical protein
MIVKLPTKKQTLIATCTAVIIACLVIGFVINDANQTSSTFSGGLEDNPKTGYYTIDPETIIGRLDRGEIDVFAPILATPEIYEASYFGPFYWKQFDYLKIAAALDQYFWNEPLDNWKIDKMTLRGECQYSPIGFDFFEMSYHKILDSKEYTRREIAIYPIFKGVAIGGGANIQLPFLGLKTLELEELKVTADDALQTAEQNGGKEARLAHNSECTIFVSISARDQKWNIRYYNNNDERIYSVNVDPYTGRTSTP